MPSNALSSQHLYIITHILHTFHHTACVITGHHVLVLRLRVRRLIIGYYFLMRDNGWCNIGTKLKQVL